MNKIIIKNAGENAIVKEAEEVNLEVMQEVVGGHIEIMHMGCDVDMVLNEEGKLNGMPPNFALCVDKGDEAEVLDMIVGNVMFCGHKGPESVGLNDIQEDFVQWKLRLSELTDTYVTDTTGDPEVDFWPIWWYNPDID